MLSTAGNLPRRETRPDKPGLSWGRQEKGRMMKPSMKLIRFMFLGILSLAALTVWAESDVALVTDVTGGVLVDCGQKPWTPEPGETLQNGVAIEIHAGGVLSLVHLKTQTEFVLKGPQKFTLAPEGVNGGKSESKTLQAQLPQNLDLIARNLADGGGKNVSNLQSSTEGPKPEFFDPAKPAQTEPNPQTAKAGSGAPAPQSPAPAFSEPSALRAAEPSPADADLHVAPTASPNLQGQTSDEKQEIPSDKGFSIEGAGSPSSGNNISNQSGAAPGLDATPNKTNATEEKAKLEMVSGKKDEHRKEMKAPGKDSSEGPGGNVKKFLIALPQELTSNKLNPVEESGLASWVYYVVPADSVDRNAVLETGLEALKPGYLAKYNLNIPLNPGVKEALICESAGQAEQATAMWIELYKSKKITLTILTAHLNRLREKILMKAGAK